jgi:Cys-rich protein (TIGR01571 family)
MLGDSSKVASTFSSCGCTPYDGAFFINCYIMNLLPCVAVLWRGEIRNKYGIEGNLVGDAVAYCCCGQLAAMQEAREVRGISSKVVLSSPSPVTDMQA